MSKKITTNTNIGSTGKATETDVRLFKVAEEDGIGNIEAIMWFRKKEEQEQTEIVLDEKIEGFYLDALQVFARVLAKRYGFTDLTDGRQISLKTGTEPGEEIMVPWGKFSVPKINDAVFEPYVDLCRGQPVLKVRATVKRKYEDAVHEVFNYTRSKLSEWSIYRGKAVKVDFSEIKDLEQLKKAPIEDFAPGFFAVTENGLDQLMFSESVREQVEDNLFFPIRHTKRVRKSDPDALNRGVLLAGPPGTGKSLTATHTAALAVENGWTFVLCSAKHLKQAYDFADRYQPAVVFCEDIDQVLGNVDPRTGEEVRNEEVDSYLNAMDSINTKDREIITVCTTNHIERMGKTVLRHGRFHIAVPVLPPDAECIERLVRWYATERTGEWEIHRLPADEDISNLCHMLAELKAVPATIQEVVKRAKLKALASTSKNDWVITAQQLETKARGMADHIALLTPKPVDRRSDLEKAADSVANAIQLAAGVNPEENQSSGISLSREAIDAYGIA